MILANRKRNGKYFQKRTLLSSSRLAAAWIWKRIRMRIGLCRTLIDAHLPQVYALVAPPIGQDYGVTNVVNSFATLAHIALECFPIPLLKIVHII